jgi:hypothetical protein
VLITVMTLASLIALTTACSSSPTSSQTAPASTDPSTTTTTVDLSWKPTVVSGISDEAAMMRAIQAAERLRIVASRLNADVGQPP